MGLVTQVCAVPTATMVKAMLTVIFPSFVLYCVGDSKVLVAVD